MSDTMLTLTFKCPYFVAVRVDIERKGASPLTGYKRTNLHCLECLKPKKRAFSTFVAYASNEH